MFYIESPQADAILNSLRIRLSSNPISQTISAFSAFSAISAFLESKQTYQTMWVPAIRGIKLYKDTTCQKV